MTYTQEQIEIFEEMFEVGTEYHCYKRNVLTQNGLAEEPTYMEEIYSTSMAHITLSDGTEYVIHYGDRLDAERAAVEAFETFIELGYDEEKFEQYLENDSAFRLG